MAEVLSSSQQIDHTPSRCILCDVPIHNDAINGSEGRQLSERLSCCGVQLHQNCHTGYAQYLMSSGKDPKRCPNPKCIANTASSFTNNHDMENNIEDREHLAGVACVQNKHSNGTHQDGNGDRKKLFGWFDRRRTSANSNSSPLGKHTEAQKLTPSPNKWESLLEGLDSFIAQEVDMPLSNHSQQQQQEDHQNNAPVQKSSVTSQKLFDNVLSEWEKDDAIVDEQPRIDFDSLSILPFVQSGSEFKAQSSTSLSLKNELHPGLSPQDMNSQHLSSPISSHDNESSTLNQSNVAEMLVDATASGSDAEGGSDAEDFDKSVRLAHVRQLSSEPSHQETVNFLEDDLRKSRGKVRERRHRQYAALEDQVKKLFSTAAEYQKRELQARKHLSEEQKRFSELQKELTARFLSDLQQRDEQIQRMDTDLQQLQYMLDQSNDRINSQQSKLNISQSDKFAETERFQVLESERQRLQKLYDESLRNFEAAQQKITELEAHLSSSLSDSEILQAQYRELVASHESMTVKFRQMQEEFDSTNKELQEKNAKVLELETRITAVDNSMQRCVELEESNAQLRADYQLLEAKAHSELEQALNQASQDAIAQFQDLQRELDEVSAKLLSKTSEIESSVAENLKLKDAIEIIEDDSRRRIEHLEQQLMEVKFESNSSKEAYETALKQRDAQLDDLMHRLVTAENDLNESQLSSEASEKNLQLLFNELEAVKTERNIMQQDLDALTSEADNLQATYDQLRMSHSDLQALADEQKVQILALQSQLDTQRHDALQTHQQFEIRVEEMTATSVALRNDLATAEQHELLLKEQVNKLIVENQKLEERCTASQVSLKALEAEQAELRNLLGASTSECDSLKARVAEAEKQAFADKRTSAELENHVSSINAELQASQHELARVEEQLVNVTNAFEDIKQSKISETEHLHGKLKQYAKVIKDLRTSQEQMKEEHAKSLEELQRQKLYAEECVRVAEQRVADVEESVAGKESMEILYQQQLDSANNQILNLQHELSSQVKRYEEASFKMTELQREFEHQCEEKSVIESEFEISQECLRTMQDDLSNMRNALAIANQDLESTRETLAERQSFIHEQQLSTEERLRQAERTIAELSERADLAEQRAAAAHDLQKAAQDELSAAPKTSDYHLQEAEGLRIQLQQNEAAFRDLEHRYVAVEAERNQLVENLTQDSESFQNRYEYLEQHCRSVTLQLQTVEDEKLKMGNEMTMIKTKLSKLVNAFKEIKTREQQLSEELRVERLQSPDASQNRELIEATDQLDMKQQNAIEASQLHLSTLQTQDESTTETETALSAAYERITELEKRIEQLTSNFENTSASTASTTVREALDENVDDDLDDSSLLSSIRTLRSRCTKLSSQLQASQQKIRVLEQDKLKLSELSVGMHSDSSDVDLLKSELASVKVTAQQHESTLQARIAQLQQQLTVLNQRSEFQAAASDSPKKTSEHKLNPDDAIISNPQKSKQLAQRAPSKSSLESATNSIPGAISFTISVSKQFLLAFALILVATSIGIVFCDYEKID